MDRRAEPRPSRDPEPLAVTPLPLERRSWPGRALHEVRSHPMAYVVLGVFVVAGGVLTPLVFPEVPTGLGFLGGLIFGGYAALCAVPDKFF